MRQAGLIAAGALYALQHHRDRLVIDHQNAQLLAQGLATIEGITIDASAVQTNIVVFETPKHSALTIVNQLEQRGIRLFATGEHKIRAVTHLMIEASHIPLALDQIRSVLGNAMG